MKRFLITTCLLCLLVPALMAQSDEEKVQAVMHADAIDWNSLADCLPDEADDMDVSDVDGGTMSMADPTNPGSKFSYSFAERTYTKGDNGIILRITDTGYSQFLTMPYMMAFEMDTPDATIKSVKVGDRDAKFIQNKEKGKVISTQYLILISERVLVMAENDGGASKDEIESMLKKIDFEKLTKLAAK
ncbi:MAG: hypothetical protein R3F48_17770 [Candidatus Zixiibacteriota bacterium]